MIRRDVESPTAFAIKVKNECNIYDLQGLCQNRANDYTIAVEAIDMGNDPVEAYVEVFTNDELYAKAKLAERLHAVFVLLLHKNIGQKDEIFLKFFKPDDNSLVANCIESKKLSSEYFVNWWKARQCRTQQKEYRDEMQRKIAASYFDQLLEVHGSSWSGNIDGFLMDKNMEGQEDVSAIIECRFSSNEDIERYDPNRFFKSGGGDYMTWSGLLELSKRLDIPLYLFTYSRRIGCREKVGLAVVEDVSRDKGLVYKNGISPCNNIKISTDEVREWLEQQKDDGESK